MACCGKAREALRATPQGQQTRRPVGIYAPPSRRELYSTAYFEYVGDTGLTVIGPYTGKVYRFDRPGARVAVDLRDKGSLVAVRLVKQLMEF